MKQPPKHLSEGARGWWRKVARGWQLDDSGYLILEIALSAYDRLNQARELIAAEGLIQNGKPHPALGAEKEARIGLLRAWRQLGLDVEPPGPIGRPPGVS